MNARIVVLMTAEQWARFLQACGQVERAKRGGWQPEIDAERGVLADVACELRQSVICASRIDA